MAELDQGALSPRDLQPSPHVLIAVCGGIAAYKACEVLRGLQKAGCELRVTMTADAARFVGPTTFEALSHHAVLEDLYGYPDDPIGHITLSEWADLALVVPATANVLAKMAAGVADDALSTTLLACTCPVLVAPAMNVHMWENPATQANVATLASRDIRFVMPDEGLLACGDVGKGKLAPVESIVAEALKLLGHDEGVGGGLTPAQDLAGWHLVVTAGPTHEPIDPVRYIANRSTGKMGYALAKAALRRGAQVTLVSGPVSLSAPEGADLIQVETAAEMHDATVTAFSAADAAICAAAVADYRPAMAADHKLKKSQEPLDHLDLVETADILAELGQSKGQRLVVGFAAETDELLSHAQEKLASKQADLIVANDVGRADSAFGSDTDRVAFVSKAGIEQLETLPKAAVADAVLDRLLQLKRSDS